MGARAVERAPAKLNLMLHILGRRPDGYHEIDSVMIPVSLYDEVRVAVRASRGRSRVRLTVRGATRGVPRDGRNLAVRAAQAFLEATGASAAVSIVLEKAIPPASGLGGGSSDAAAVLRALCALQPGVIPRHRLLEIAARIGADVPFFLRGRPARVGGIGEIVRPFRGRILPWFVVAVPRPGVSTAAAYRALRLTREGASSRLRRFRHSVSYRVNDLETAVIPRRPDIGRLKGYLQEAGARTALMSGSGSAVFGAFATQKRARAAAARLPRGTRVFVVKALTRPPTPARRPAGRSPSW